MKTLLPVAIIALVAGPTLAAEREATDAELRAFYCMGVLPGDIAFLKSILATFPMAPPGSPEAQVSATLQKQIATEGDGYTRLRAYTLPKMEYLDLTGPVLAQKRGEAQVQTITTSGHNIDELGTGAAAAYKSCRNIDWLPF